MPGPDEKGSFAADIPASVLEEALRSVERRAAEGKAEPPPEDDVAVEPPEPELAGEVKRLEEELAAEHDRLLRTAADLENFRKRVARDREESARNAPGPVVKDLIPAIDNLERALTAAPQGDPLADGVRMVLKQVEEALARHGVEPRNALGEPFDPALHEALATVVAPDAAPGTVVAQHGRAWMLHGRLLRPAMVAVAAPDSAGGQGE
ncbi:MAG: nucleotide exchange factor GrpE [Deltaproteobacteria bacterium]